MNRVLRLLLLASALAALLCVSVFAVDDSTIIDVAKEEAFAECIQMEIQDAVKLRVTYNKAQDGAQYLILVTNTQINSSADITDATVEYIDQAGAADDSVSFTVNQRRLTSGKTYYVYLSSNADSATITSRTLVGTYGYYAPYTLGDVNNDSEIEPYDATLILQYYVGLETDESFGTKGYSLDAADVNRDTEIEPYDATLVLQHYVGLIDISEQ